MCDIFICQSTHLDHCLLQYVRKHMNYIHPWNNSWTLWSGSDAAHFNPAAHHFLWDAFWDTNFHRLQYATLSAKALQPRSYTSKYTPAEFLADTMKCFHHAPLAFRRFDNLTDQWCKYFAQILLSHLSAMLNSTCILTLTLPKVIGFLCMKQGMHGNGELISPVWEYVAIILALYALMNGISSHHSWKCYFDGCFYYRWTDHRAYSAISLRRFSWSGFGWWKITSWLKATAPPTFNRELVNCGLCDAFELAASFTACIAK